MAQKISNLDNTTLSILRFIQMRKKLPQKTLSQEKNMKETIQAQQKERTEVDGPTKYQKCVVFLELNCNNYLQFSTIDINLIIYMIIRRFKKENQLYYVLKIFDFGVKMRCVQEMISLSIKHLPRMHYFERN